MNITAARCQVVAFTVPVTAQQDALYVKPGNPKKLTGYASAAVNPSDVENMSAKAGTVGWYLAPSSAIAQGNEPGMEPIHNQD